jgi:hypothetical protein
MTNKQLGPVVRAWLKRTDVGPEDVRRSTDHISVRIPETRQRGRWWPVPSFRRPHDPPDSTRSTDLQPTPIPATDGHSPTVLGRTQFMLSPVKAITAGALVFALGGVLLIAQPFEQGGSGSPGAATTEAIAPTWVTGTVQPAPSCSGPDSVESDGDVQHEWIIECSPQTWTSSDPRLTGEVVRRWNDDVFRTDEGIISLSMDAAYLRNDDGGWACSNSSLAKGSGMSTTDVTGGTFTHTCIGDGGYEGLSALLVSEFTVGFSEEFVGLIFSGDFPPLPEPPSVE